MASKVVYSSQNKIKFFLSKQIPCFADQILRKEIFGYIQQLCIHQRRNHVNSHIEQEQGTLDISAGQRGKDQKEKINPRYLVYDRGCLVHPVFKSPPS